MSFPDPLNATVAEVFDEEGAVAILVPERHAVCSTWPWLGAPMKWVVSVSKEKPSPFREPGPSWEANLIVDGRSIATVWDSGAWHTWDPTGVGGENSSCHFVRYLFWEEDPVEVPDPLRAMAEAQEAAIRQGFHKGRTRPSVRKDWRAHLS